VIKRYQFHRIEDRILVIFLDGWLRTRLVPQLVNGGTAPDNPVQHERKNTMTPRVHTHRRTESSAEIESSDSSSSDNHAEPSKNYQGDYSEGQVAKSVNATSAEKIFTPLCPAPVRLAIGVFSMLGAAAGMTMAIVAGNALNSPSDPEADLHRAMFGAGAAMLGLGFIGVLSTQVKKEQPALSTLSA
jgi:hypothetical protein